MSQQHLHDPQIRTMIEQMRSKGMSQYMGRQRLFDPGLHGMALDQIPEGLACHGLTALCNKQAVAEPSLQHLGPGRLEITRHPVKRLLPHGHQSGLDRSEERSGGKECGSTCRY